MNRIAAASAALLASTALAQAGGLDRNQLGTGILFEEGTYAELGYSFVDPKVSGVLREAPVSSGDMASSYSITTLSYRTEFSDALSFAMIIDQPYGAASHYNTAGYPLNGTRAVLDTQRLTAALRYEMGNGMSVFGGAQALRAQGDIYVSLATGVAASSFSYSLNADSDWDYGFMGGVAYEIPEIALRVALTYFSSVELGMSGSEGLAGGAGGLTPAVAATAFNVTMPETILLEAQSGIAADTLLFGSIRWTAWDGFDITPNSYPNGLGDVGGSLVDYTADVFTYTLGLGRRLNENWALSTSVSHEAAEGTLTGNLGPTDGRTSFGIGAEYTQGAMSIAGGVQYTNVGDAVAGLGGNPFADFTNNEALAFGLRLGFQF